MERTERPVSILCLEIQPSHLKASIRIYVHTNGAVKLRTCGTIKKVGVGYFQRVQYMPFLQIGVPSATDFYDRRERHKSKERIKSRLVTRISHKKGCGRQSVKESLQ